MAFRIGMKVVCVDDREHSGNLLSPVVGPVKDHVYTIRDTAISPSGKEHLRLDEIHNATQETPGGTGEPWFLAKRFRLVTDISALRDLVQEVFHKRDLSADHELDRRKKVKAGGRA